MTPYETASELYRKNPQLGSFDQLLTLHLKDGVVMSGPTVFLMARKISTVTISDTWFIECGVGSMEAMLSAMPFWLPYIGFSHKGRFRVYATARIINRIPTEERVQNGFADTMPLWRRPGQSEASGSAVPHVGGRERGEGQNP